MRMIQLTIKQGSLVQTYALDTEKAFIGRLDTNTVKVDHASVSRKHCMIRKTSSGGLEVLDLNSHHGTLVNGKSVDRGELAEGDELRIGEVQVLIGFPQGAGTAPAAAPKPEGEAPAKSGKALVSEGRRDTFSELLYRQLAQAPWWAASVLFHTLLVYAFFFVVYQPAPGDTPSGSLNGDLSREFASEMDDLPESPDDLLDRRPPELAEPPLPELAEGGPAPADVEDLDEDLEQPMLPDVGPVATDLAPSFLPGGLSTGIGVPEAEFGKDGASGANRDAGTLLRRSLAGRGSDSLGSLHRLSPHEILVVEGSYDRVEEILDLLDIRYELTPVPRLDRLPLAGRKVVIVNCSNHAPSARAIERLRDFVASGGYLLGSDWAVENVIRRAFPGTIEPLMRENRKVLTPDETIHVHVAKAARRHPLVRGTALLREEARWWLEESSYPFQVMDALEVEVLVESADLARKYGTPSVAATFRHGRGRVLHMLGHFYQQEGNLKGAFSAQRIIANFLISAIRKQ